MPSSSVAPAISPPVQPGNLPGVRRTRGLANVLTVQLPLTAAALLAVAGTSRNETIAFDDYRAGIADQADLDRAADALNMAGVATGVLYALGVVVFAVWCWRTFANAQLIASSSTPGTGWAIGGWAIPLVNLVAPPYNLMRVDRASGGTGPGAWPLIATWWVLFIGGPLFSGRRNIGPGGGGARVGSEGSYVLTFTLLAAAAVACLLMVRTMTSRQERALVERHGRLLDADDKRAAGARARAGTPLLAQRYGPASRAPLVTPTYGQAPRPPSAPTSPPRLLPNAPTFGQTRRAPLAELPEDDDQYG